MDFRIIESMKDHIAALKFSALPKLQKKEDPASCCLIKIQTWTLKNVWTI